jgi:uncharacterized repeat protein (TIGR02543 family)
VAGTGAETYAKSKGITFVNKEVPITAISITPAELHLAKGTTTELILTVEPSNFTDAITWISEDTSIATVTDGKVKGVAIGETTIYAFAGDTGELAGECKVTVVQPVTSISLNTTKLSLDGGDTYALTATVNPSNAYNKEVVWSSADETIATVSETGVVTAVSKGSVKITATAADGSGKSKYCTVTVNNTPVYAQSVEELQSAHNYANNVNEVWIYTLDGAEEIEVTFSTDTAFNKFGEGDYLYIYDGNGNEVGKYTSTDLAGKTVKISDDTVKLKLVTDNALVAYGFRVESVVKYVKPVPLKGITLDRTSLRLKAGAEADLTVLYNPENTTVLKVVNWTSSNEKVATVNKGKITALSAGSTVITAEVDGKTATCQVNVWQGVSTVSFAEDTITLHKGETAKIAYKIWPASAYFDQVQWSSTNSGATSLIAMDGMGYAEITGMAAGTDSITVDVDGKSATFDVVVKDTVTLNYQDGSQNQDITVSYGETIADLEAMVPEREGFIFAGWFTEENGLGEKVTSETVINDEWTLYAYWKQAPEGFWVEPIGDVMYTGKALKPAVKVYDGTTLLKEKTDYTVSYKNNTKVYTGSDPKKMPTITVKGKGNYTGTATLNFNILPQNIENYSL